PGAGNVDTRALVELDPLEARVVVDADLAAAEQGALERAHCAPRYRTGVRRCQAPFGARAPAPTRLAISIPAIVPFATVAPKKAANCTGRCKRSDRGKANYANAQSGGPAGPPAHPANPSVGFGRRHRARPDVLVEPAVDRRGVAPRGRDLAERLPAVQPGRRAERPADVHPLHAEKLDAP